MTCKTVISIILNWGNLYRKTTPCKFGYESYKVTTDRKPVL